MIGIAYSNHGLTFRTSTGSDLSGGEIFFPTTPSRADLIAAFPDYLAAITRASARDRLNLAGNGPLQMAWTTSTMLNNSYAIDQQTQFFIIAELVSMLLNNCFTNGQAARNWPTMSGTYNLMTMDQFKAFATAVALYVDQSRTAFAMAAAGQLPTWPNTNITVNA